MSRLRPRLSLRHHLVLMALALLPAWASAANAGPSIPGIFAINGTLNIIGTKVSNNDCTVGLDASGDWCVVTLNGQTIEYPAAEVNVIAYYGGQQGSDTFTMSATYSYQLTSANFYGGHNSVTIAAHECEVLIYGDYNAITTTTGGVAIVIGEEGAHNTYTGSGVSDVTAAASNVYASTIPGVYGQFGTFYIALDPTRANTVSVAPVSAGTKFTINGATDTIPSSVTVGSLIFTSGVVNGDTIDVTVPSIHVKGWLFPDQELISLTDDICTFDVIGTGDIITATAGSTGPVTVVYDGSTKPTLTVPAGMSVTYSQGGPMIGTIPAGGASGSTGSSSSSSSGSGSTASGSGSGSVVSSGGGSSGGGCGFGGSMAVLAGLACVWTRRRHGMA